MSKTWRLFDVADLTFYDVNTGEEITSWNNANVSANITEQVFDKVSEGIMNSECHVPPYHIQGKVYDFREDYSDEHIVITLTLGKFRKVLATKDWIESFNRMRNGVDI